MFILCDYVYTYILHMYTGPKGSPMIIINLLPVAKPYRASSAMMRGSNVEEDESSLTADDVRRKRQGWGVSKNVGSP